jgi:hypothetical protein
MRSWRSAALTSIMAALPETHRLRAAADLVLRDARNTLGSDVLAIAYAEDDLPDELGGLTDPVNQAPSWDVFSVSDAFVYVRGELGGTGLADNPGLTEQELLVHVAEAIQEQAIESSAYFGRGFPRCPEHPDGAPLWATVVDGQAMWACLDGGKFKVPIGELPAS